MKVLPSKTSTIMLVNYSKMNQNLKFEMMV